MPEESELKRHLVGGALVRWVEVFSSVARTSRVGALLRGELLFLAGHLRQDFLSRRRGPLLRRELTWAQGKRAESLMQVLQKRFPFHTMLQSYWLPTIRASNLLSSRKRRLTRHSRLHRNNLP